MATMQELANRKEYSEVYDRMNWLLPKQAEAAASTRNSLVDLIASHPESNWVYSQTKLYTHAISPGCALCGQGEWSCLFINGICNARCFYCPTSQDDSGPPMANAIVFDDPRDYADYVSRFHIKGVGFSGGEPFLTFNRLLSYLETLKARADHPVYTWMYTNGKLVNREKLSALRDGGLDEIRFDLSANQYRLGVLEQALHVIPRVAVEIPAIPEDISIIKQLITDLEQLGVDFLNLHQIRCTRFNVKHLINRGYTFIHGPKVTVLETELTALELIRYALERSIELPINYCAFTFRHQFQQRGVRKRNATKIKAGCEDITPTGHIRHMKIVGKVNTIAKICQSLLSRQIENSRYLVSSKKDSVSFAAELWPLIDFSNVRLNVSYCLAVLRPAVSYHHPFKKIVLNKGKTLVVEKQVIQPAFWLEGEQIDLFGQMIHHPEGMVPHQLSDTLAQEQFDRMVAFESISQGLARYY
jgi:pyruvate formate-lyase activating enzyme-like uncharacterized protein